MEEKQTHRRSSWFSGFGGGKRGKKKVSLEGEARVEARRSSKVESYWKTSSIQVHFPLAPYICAGPMCGSSLLIRRSKLP